MKCPRCGAAAFRDYQDWWCFSCGEISRAVDEAERAAMRAEVEPEPGRTRRHGPMRFIDGRGVRLR